MGRASATCLGAKARPVDDCTAARVATSRGGEMAPREHRRLIRIAELVAETARCHLVCPPPGSARASARPACDGIALVSADVDAAPRRCPPWPDHRRF
eukprot:4967597-Pyramimonas_sp.AAC.1